MDAESPSILPLSSRSDAIELARTIQSLISHLASEQPLHQICERSGLETYDYDPELRRCWTALEHGPLPLRFDWPQWQAEAQAMEQEPDRIAQADLLTLRKLLTCYLRQERFVAGTLAQIIENGQLLRVLQRLLALMGDDVGQEAGHEATAAGA